jgi:hypothetical protein
MRFIVGLVWLFLVQFGFGQTDQAKLIFIDETELEGYATIKKNKILFRLTLKDIADEWDENMVKKIVFYGYNTVFIYEYLQINERDKPRLFEVVTEGEVTLYSDFTRDKNGWNNWQDNIRSPMRSFNFFDGNVDMPDIYIKRDFEEYPVDLNHNFKNQIIDYFSDCEVLVEKIKTGKLRKTQINEIVDYYNDNCTE